MHVFSEHGHRAVLQNWRSWCYLFCWWKDITLATVMLLGFTREPEWITTLCHIKIHRFKLNKTATLERHEVLKIEDRVQCRMCFAHQRQGETCCIGGIILQGITEEVKKQAEQRINCRFIMYVPGIHKLALKNNQIGRSYGKSAESKKNKRARYYVEFAQKHNRGTIVERYL